jgi:hypothetical protein
LSGRAISLHVAVLVVVPGCAIAAWWQINRAQDGNQLSYFYSVMWPAFGLVALTFWWMLLHTDYETVGLRGMRRRQAEQAQPTPNLTKGAATASADSTTILGHEEDPELAAYNARLAELSATGPKTWRRKESIVVRRSQ